MSISLVLVPVALAMRVVMGKDRFNKWVEASLVRIPTNIDDSEALVLAVRKAGFDIEPWGGFIRPMFEARSFGCSGNVSMAGGMRYSARRILVQISTLLWPILKLNWEPQFLHLRLVAQRKSKSSQRFSRPIFGMRLYFVIR